MNERARLIVAIAAVIVVSGCGGDSSTSGNPGGCGPGQLTSSPTRNNSHNGNMFDVVAVSPVVVTGLTINLTSGTGVGVAIYERAGTYVGHETVAADWTLAGTATVDYSASGPVPIPVALSIPIAQGQRHAFYVTATSGTTLVGYANGTAVGAIAAQDGAIQILEGSGNAYPFGGFYTPRVWIGTVSYCL